MAAPVSFIRLLGDALDYFGRKRVVGITNFDLDFQYDALCQGKVIVS